MPHCANPPLPRVTGLDTKGEEAQTTSEAILFELVWKVTDFSMGFSNMVSHRQCLPAAKLLARRAHRSSLDDVVDPGGAGRLAIWLLAEFCGSVNEARPGPND